MQKTVLTENDSIKVSRYNFEDGTSIDKVKMKISDTTCITGCYLNQFVDVEGYKRRKQMKQYEIK